MTAALHPDFVPIWEVKLNNKVVDYEKDYPVAVATLATYARIAFAHGEMPNLEIKSTRVKRSKLAEMGLDN